VTRKFQVSADGAGYAMIDTTRTAGGIRTYDAKNTQSLPGTLMASTSLTSWDTSATKGRGAAVDAHYSAGVVFDFYKGAFGRSGIDGKGGGMTSTAHFAQSLDNALWDPESKQMMYGDGGQIFRPLAGALDVVAHEFTHGVTQAEAGLVYQDQPGALNEAISDIFAALIEHAVSPDPVKNFQIGEEIALAGYIRDMKNPGAKQQPSHMTQLVKTTQDNGGVHINSGIVNNAFYLMTNGGVNPKSQIEVKRGIGWEKSAQIWYRTLAELLVAKSDFAAVAQANARAAKDLSLTQAEQDAVACAWIATGVLKGTCAEVVEEPAPAEEPAAAPTEPEATASRPRPSSTVETSSCSAAPGGPGAGSALALLGIAASARRRRRGTAPG
jgi:thermolysin